jgi:hypothetical protein
MRKPACASAILLTLFILNYSARAAEPPNPPRATVTETPEQRAARLLQEAAKLDSVRTQEKRQEADSAYQTGLRLMNDLEYEQAKRWFERALEVVPGFDLAREKLRTVNSVLGVHTERVAERTRELAADANVQAQESVLVIQNLIEDARRLEERATILPRDSETSSRADMLAEQLKNLQKAQDKLLRAKELIYWLPPYVKYDGRGNVDAELKRLKEQLGK